MKNDDNRLKGGIKARIEGWQNESASHRSLISA